MRLTLPWPPSVNTYWRHPHRGALAGRHLLSEDGRKYRKVVGDMVRANRQAVGLRARLKVVLTACPPDLRRRDLDNLQKGLLDSLQHAGVYEDDSQIDDLRILRGPVVKGGRVDVVVEPLDVTDTGWRRALGDA